MLEEDDELDGSYHINTPDHSATDISMLSSGHPAYMSV